MSVGQLVVLTAVKGEGFDDNFLVKSSAFTSLFDYEELWECEKVSLKELISWARSQAWIENSPYHLTENALSIFSFKIVYHAEIIHNRPFSYNYFPNVQVVKFVPCAYAFCNS